MIYVNFSGKNAAKTHEGFTRRLFLKQRAYTTTHYGSALKGRNFNTGMS